jgi:hypothetical protein
LGCETILSFVTGANHVVQYAYGKLKANPVQSQKVMSMSIAIQCPFCLDEFTVMIYREDGEFQDLIYDCEICCHPVEIIARWTYDRDDPSIETTRSTGF